MLEPWKDKHEAGEQEGRAEMGKSWMGFHEPILQSQKSHPNPQSLPGVGTAWRCCQLCSHSSLFLILPLPRVLPQGGEAEPTSHPQFQELGGSDSPGAQ